MKLVRYIPWGSTIFFKNLRIPRITRSASTKSYHLPSTGAAAAFPSTHTQHALGTSVSYTPTNSSPTCSCSSFTHLKIHP